MHYVPSGMADGALVGHLNTTTHCTTNFDTLKHFYGEILKMTIDGPIKQSEADKEEQKSFYHIPEDVDYDLYHFHRPSVPSLIHMRVLHLKKATPMIHDSYKCTELGSFSLGLPCLDAVALDERMAEYGIGKMAPMQKGDIVRADGVPGHYLETIYQGPDFLHCVGIERLGISPLAPCDPETGLGAPGYSALVTTDSDAEVDFYTKVLDHYTQLDAVWEAAEGSALGVAQGVPFRFTSFYAREAKQNHIIMLDFKDGSMIDNGVQSCLPNQGLGMYTFYTNDIEKIHERAIANEAKILSPIKTRTDHILGTGRSLLLEAPSGMYIEIFEKK